MNFHRRHGVCCEIRQDLGISPRSIQRFTSGQIWICWPGLVLFTIKPNILEWKSGPAAGHIAWNAVTDVFHLHVPKKRNLLCMLLGRFLFKKKKIKGFNENPLCASALQKLARVCIRVSKTFAFFIYKLFLLFT